MLNFAPESQQFSQNSNLLMPRNVKTGTTIRTNIENINKKNKTDLIQGISWLLLGKTLTIANKSNASLTFLDQLSNDRIKVKDCRVIKMSWRWGFFPFKSVHQAILIINGKVICVTNVGQLKITPAAIRHCSQFTWLPQEITVVICCPAVPSSIYHSHSPSNTVRMLEKLPFNQQSEADGEFCYRKS